MVFNADGTDFLYVFLIIRTSKYMIKTAISNWLHEKKDMVTGKVATGEAKAALLTANLMIAVIVFILFNMGLVAIIFSHEEDYGKGCIIFSLAYALILLFIMSFRKKVVRMVKRIYTGMFLVDKKDA